MQSAPTSADPVPTFREGQTLAGCYVLRKQAQSGLDRVVWLAEDEVLGKEVSLHFVPPAVLADDVAIGVLRHEVKRTRQLIHPNILRVYDFVQEEGWASVAMDAFTGQTLSAQISAKPGHCFEVAEVRPWLHAICHTLDDAHRIQLVHGDLTPENVFIEEHERVRVANFGLSLCVKRALGELAPDRENTEGAAHQSPQQIAGGVPTVADDVYAIGVLIFRLLTGGFPFPDRASRNTVPSINARRAELGSGAKSVPPTWEQVVAACLQESPAARPQSALEIVRALSLDRAEPEAEAEEPAVAVVPAAPLAVAEPPAAPLPPPPEAAPEIAAAIVPPAVAASRESDAAPASPKTAAPEAELSKPEAPVEVDETPRAREDVQAATPPADEPPTPWRDVPRGGGSRPKDERPPEAARQRERKKAPSTRPERETFIGPGKGLASKRTVAIAAAVVGLIAMIAFFTRDGDDRPTANAVSDAPAEANSGIPVPHVATNNPEAAAEPGGPGDVKLNLDRPQAQPNATPSTTSEPREPLPATNTPNLGSGPSTAGPPGKTPAKANADAQARNELAAAEKALEAAGQRQHESEAAVAAAKAKVDAAAKALAGAQKASADVAATRKVRADEVKASEQAHRQSEQTASERRRLAEEARSAVGKVDESLAALKAMVDADGKPFPPVKKAIDEMAAVRKKRDGAATAAESTAQQAQTTATEKARRAQQAREALVDFEARTEEQMAGVSRTESELKELQKALGQAQESATAAAAAAQEAATRRDQALAKVQQDDNAMNEARLAAERLNADKLAAEAKAAESARMARAAEEQKAADAKRAEAQKLAGAQKEAEMKKAAEVEKARALLQKEEEEEMAKIQKAFAERRAKVEAALAGSAGNPGAAGPPKPPTDDSNAPPPNTPTAPAPPSTTEMAKLETKPAAPVSPGSPQTPNADAEAGTQHVNSLGMNFVPVADVVMSIWLTRVKDFEVFAKAAGLKSIAWRDPGFKQGPDHPVVSVSWQEANLFCKWLTARERKDGQLAADQEYRLPTDVEWSRAVGLPEEPGPTPEARDMVIQDVYPWGTAWPPPAGAGNYTGEETGSDVAIRGYSDGFPWTAPVGSFASNKFGLFDMGGNVWQWCLDSWNNESKAKVLRGASWYNGALKLSLLSSCRIKAAPDGTTDNYGFRVVIAGIATEKSARR